MKRLFGIAIVVFFAGTVFLRASRTELASPNRADSRGCPSDDTGLKLPAGFCATIFADGIGYARHMAVAPDNVVYVNTWSGRYYGNKPAHEGGFLVALQDTTRSGKANVIKRFGETVQMGGAGGVGIALYKNAIYAEINDRIAKYPLPTGSIAPNVGRGTTVVSGLPLTGDHPMHPFIIDSQGAMYVDDATPTNSCQIKNRVPQSPGEVPCTELKTRGGVWRYDANKTDQVFSAAGRYATGIRNAEGLAFIDGLLFATQHGRDQLYANWRQFYRPDQEATLPAEELLLLKQGGDYGWPECYYDSFVQRLVLAPEYGGDGKQFGVCAKKIEPVAAFPAHWAPNGMVHYDKTQFPERYRNGVFIAFHGSWDRAPYPQGGYNVVFQPLSGAHASGSCEVFADGFAGRNESPQQAAHRPTGLAVGPDGALYVSDDVTGRIYRITYRGGPFDASGITPCPSLTAPAGEIGGAAANPPEGTHPNAGREVASLPVPRGATHAMVALGEKIYRSQAGGSTCTGCHGDNAQGTPLGPNLTDHKWVWSNGSYAGIARTITNGVPRPKNYRNVMPPMRDQLTPDQVKAVAAYVWSLSHRSQ
jgi:glucose/arabinose dehydrogenase/mono/diheme cytochrome c family protein